MKTSFLKTTRCAAALLAVSLAGTFVTLAADPPEPTAPDRGGGNNARGRGGFGGQGPGGMGGLGLDDKQRELYREATQKDSDELRQLDEKLRAAQKELLTAVLAEDYSDKTVREKAEVVAKIQTDITVLRAKALSTVAPTLKPEQREQLENSRIGAAMLTSGGFGGGGGFGQGGGGGPDGQGGFRGRNAQAQPGVDGGPRDRGQRGNGNGNGGNQRRRGQGQPGEPGQPGQ